MLIESDILKNSAAFTITLTQWGNIRKADKGRIQTDSDKSMLKLSKTLVDSPEYDTIKSFQSKIREWIESRSVPSFFRRGIYLFNLSMVEEVETFLKDQIEKQKELVEKLVEVYPQRIEDARNRLNGMFQDKDYPTTDELRSMFTITWYWTYFGVPDNLPKEIFEREKEKAEQMWAEAAEQITMCLREGFQKLIAHATDRLRVAPGEKPKIFRDSLIGNIQEFIATFNARNLTNDSELQALIEKTKEILTGSNAEILRDDTTMRNYTAKKFEEIKKTLDTMIVERPSRKFAFDE